MSTETIRQQLCDYIRVAEDRRLQAICTRLETEPESPSASRSIDAGIVAEIDRRSKEYKSSKV